MIYKNNRVYSTVAISRGPDGSIGVLLPGYKYRIIVRNDERKHGGHYRLHSALDWLLSENEGEATE